MQPTADAPAAGELEALSVQEVLAGEVPLAKALSFMLRLGTIGLGCPVEIEFALKLRQSADTRHELHLLQIRPQAQVAAQKAMGLRFQYLPTEEYAAITSRQALGNGRFDGICDVIYVSPERFEREATETIAAEISELNAQARRGWRVPNPHPHPPPSPLTLTPHPHPSPSPLTLTPQPHP